MKLWEEPKNELPRSMWKEDVLFGVVSAGAVVVVVSLNFLLFVGLVWVVVAILRKLGVI